MKTCLHTNVRFIGAMVSEFRVFKDAAEAADELVKVMFSCILYSFHPIFYMQLLFHMFSTLMSQIKVKPEIFLHMAIMLDRPHWQSLYTQYYCTV